MAGPTLAKLRRSWDKQSRTDGFQIEQQQRLRRGVVERIIARKPPVPASG